MHEHPELRFGDRLIESLAVEPSRTIFATMEAPWNLVLPRLSFAPEHIVTVTTMERADIDRAEEALPDFDVIIGIGGGSCVDFAKYIAWKRGARLILIPSIASVDACVTHLVAVREGGRVRNVGNARAERLLIDFALISAAMPRLNRAGAADIFSIHTASFDWMLGYRKNNEQYSERIAAECAEAVRELERSADDINAVNNNGIRKLIELFEVENDLCLELGNYRPEEGSEHFFAYNAEHLTGKHFIHGELVSLGILLMSRLQNNEPECVKSLLDKLGVLYRPQDIGLEIDELRQILLTLADYCRKENLPHTIINETEITPAVVSNMTSDL